MHFVPNECLPVSQSLGSRAGGMPKASRDRSLGTFAKNMSDSKVIGYFAIQPPANCFCDGDALIVTGSHATMKRMHAIAGVSQPSSYKIMKARFGEVLAGMKRGGSYAFDAESYKKFALLTKERGIPCCDYDFTPSKPEEIKLVTISTTA